MLREVHAACERSEIADLPRTVAVLRAHLDEPVVACAALYWVEKNLTLPQLYSARLTTHSLPIYLGLVGTLADRHPALRRKVLRLLVRTLALTLALNLTPTLTLTLYLRPRT